MTMMNGNYNKPRCTPGIELDIDLSTILYKPIYSYYFWITVVQLENVKGTPNIREMLEGKTTN
jgi:hypothetical protein